MAFGQKYNLETSHISSVFLKLIVWWLGQAKNTNKSINNDKLQTKVPVVFIYGMNKLCSEGDSVPFLTDF